MSWRGQIRWREITNERLGELASQGHRQRGLFPHRWVILPRPGPDGYKLAQRMCGIEDPDSLWELVLFAAEPAIEEFPRELFFDDDVLWHRQHLGRPGQVAYADLVVDDGTMWSMSHVSDLVQRIGLRREHKTRIENRLEGWHDLLLNALLTVALERGIRRWYVPTSTLQLRHTDPARDVGPELFERLYDRSVNRILSVEREGEWWRVDVVANASRAVSPSARLEPVTLGGTVCVSHDVEAGLGHVGIDEELESLANATWQRSVTAMLEHEAAAGIRATYNVVGRLLADVRQDIAAGGHCIGFHSYDHRLDESDQLAACRDVDYRIKGYRAPQSRITPDLSDGNLLFHNFEWLASSAYSLGFERPQLHHGIVTIPVHVDDFALYRDATPFATWREVVRERVAANDIAVISLHDCYAHLWLAGYAGLLAELGGLGTMRTLDEVAADVTLASSR